RVVERLEEPMALVRLASEIVFQLLELPLVLREDERVLIDRGDLLVDPGEGFLRAGLFLAQFPDQVGTVREPFQFARDSRHALFQPPLVTERAERGLPVDVGPEGGDLAMQLVDSILRLVASLLVLVLREVELPPRRAGDDRTHRSCFASRSFISSESASRAAWSCATRSPRCLRSSSKPPSCCRNAGRRPSASSRAAISASFAWMSPFTDVKRSFARSRACSKISRRKSF